MAASDRGRRSSVSASPPPADRGMRAWLWLAVSGSWSEREYHSCAPSSRTESIARQAGPYDHIILYCIIVAGIMKHKIIKFLLIFCFEFC